MKKVAPTFAGAGQAALRPTVGVNTAVGKTLGGKGVQIGGGIGIMGGAPAAQGIADDAKNFANQTQMAHQNWASNMEGFMKNRRTEAVDPVGVGGGVNPHYTANFG